MLVPFVQPSWDHMARLRAKEDIRGLSRVLRRRRFWYQLRRAAAEALGEIGDPRAVEPLCACLTDKYWIDRELSPLVCAAAASALGEIGDPRAVEPLCAAVAYTNVRVEVVATAAELRRWTKKGYTFVASTHGLSSVRSAAAEALGKVGDPRAIEPLCAALTDEYQKSFSIPLDAHQESLIEAFGVQDEDAREAAAKALGKIGDPRAVEPLCAALTDEYSTNLRICAAKALGEIGDPRAVEPLHHALALSDHSLQRDAIAAALTRLKGRGSRG